MLRKVNTKQCLTKIEVLVIRQTLPLVFNIQKLEAKERSGFRVWWRNLWVPGSWVNLTNDEDVCSQFRLSPASLLTASIKETPGQDSLYLTFYFHSDCAAVITWFGIQDMISLPQCPHLELVPSDSSLIQSLLGLGALISKKGYEWSAKLML